MIYSDYKIKKLFIDDKKYPKNFLDLPDPPSQIYYRGSLSKIDFTKCLAVVGSRNMSFYGKLVLERFIPDLVAANVTIVSGFMYGVDTYAHKLAVECGGATIAVFGNGLDIVYPVENDKLYSQILEKGAVISEYESNTKPHLWTYPKRNRLVAAFSQMGTFVIEASDDSGSLITAKYARKLKRKVWAVPGQITSKTSQGTNKMIKNNHAKMVLGVGDIVRIEHKASIDKDKPVLSGLDAKIYQTILRENLTLDELCLALSEEIEVVTSTVTVMCIEQIIEEIGGKYYVKK